MTSENIPAKLAELIEKINEWERRIGSGIDRIKRLENEARSLENELRQGEQLAKELTDLAASLRDSIPSDREAEDTVPPEAVTTDETAAVPEEEPPTEQPVPETPVMNTPGSAESEDQIADPPEERPQMTDITDRPSLNEALKSEQDGLGDRLSQAKVEDLRRVIGVNERFTFINQLFDGDAGSYDRVIRTINEMHSYQEANGYLQQHLSNSENWTDDNKVAVQFKQLIRKRFDA